MMLRSRQFITAVSLTQQSVGLVSVDPHRQPTTSRFRRHICATQAPHLVREMDRRTIGLLFCDFMYSVICSWYSRVTVCAGPLAVFISTALFADRQSPSKRRELKRIG